MKLQIGLIFYVWYVFNIPQHIVDMSFFYSKSNRNIKDNTLNMPYYLYV